MEFVKSFTPPDFQAKNFTPSISPYFYSFSDKNTKKMSENGEIYTTGKNFKLPPALTALTNSTSESTEHLNLIFLISNKLQFSFSLCRPHKSPVLCIFV